MKTPTEEIQYLGQMLSASTIDDNTRLTAIHNRLGELMGKCSICNGGGWVPSNTDADTDPCPKCMFPKVQTTRNHE